MTKMRKKDTGRMNPEEHKEEAVTTNFIMRDPDLEKSSAQDSDSSSQAQPQPQTHSSYEAQQNIPHYQEFQYHRAAGQNAFQEEAMPKKKRRLCKEGSRPCWRSTCLWCGCRKHHGWDQLGSRSLWK